jgi:hypothetical protein
VSQFSHSAEERRAAERRHALRNQNPHKPAVIAMHMWSAEYATGGGGSMDFWDKLSVSRKQICRECVERLAKAPEEVKFLGYTVETKGKA